MVIIRAMGVVDLLDTAVGVEMVSIGACDDFVDAEVLIYSAGGKLLCRAVIIHWTVISERSVYRHRKEG